MQTRDDLISILDRLGIEEPTRTYVLDSFHSPSREVTSHPGTVTGRYISSKSGTLVDLESLGETSYAYRLDHQENDVVCWITQPAKIDVIYHNPETNRSSRNQFHPDFLVVRESAVVEVVDRSSRSMLIRKAAMHPHNYRWEIESDTYRCPPKEEAAARLKLSYSILIPNLEDQIIHENQRFLHIHRNGSAVSDETNSLLAQLFDDRPWVSLQDIIDEGFINRIDEIYAAIANNQILSSVCKIPIREYGKFLLFKDKSAATLHEGIEDVSPNIYRLNRLSRPKLGELLFISGVEHRVVDSEGATIKLMKNDGEFRRLSPAEFHKLEDSGSLVRPGKPQNHNGSDYLLGYSYTHPKDLKEGEQRVAILDSIYSGKTTAKDHEISRWTFEDWRRKDRRAVSTGHARALALAPKHSKKGNRNPKASPAALQLAREAYANHYKTPASPNIYSAWNKYKNICKEKNVQRISMPAFYALRPKLLGPQKLDAGRVGRRAAYSDSSFKEDYGYNTTREGSRPFELGLMDSTQIDLECCSSKSGKVLARPWLTILFDAYTKMIIAFALLYERPSAVTVMILIRDCVRRHGRAPTVIKSDRAGEFKGLYMRDVISKIIPFSESNPPGEPRFNAFCERWFGKLNTELFHNLPGNTKATRNPRSITKGFAPRDHAQHTLAEGYYLIENFTQRIYANTLNPILGKTPLEAMHDGLLLAGMDQMPRIAFDENLIISTCPPVNRSGTRVFVKPRGVKVNSVFYSNPHLDSAIGTRLKVNVVYNPFDLSQVYVFALGEWHECINRRFRHKFAYRSEAELSMITSEYRQQHKEIEKGRELSGELTAHLLETMATDPDHMSFVEQQRETLSVLAQIGLLGADFHNRLQTHFGEFDDGVDDEDHEEYEDDEPRLHTQVETPLLKELT